jgi:DNA-binding transcriptional LysR family regulator
VSLQQLRCFCAAFELGSFTAAADTLRVTQPAVAEQIRKLEQALGADLFVRAGRGVVPTEAGRAFAVHAARSLRAVEDAADRPAIPPPTITTSRVMAPIIGTGEPTR